MTGLTITPLKSQPFGAKVELPTYCNNNPLNLNESDFIKLYKANLTYLVLVIPNQQDLSPKNQYELTKKFDPSIPIPKTENSANYGHGKEFRHQQSVLRKDGCSVKSQPQVQILGQGIFQPGEVGNENDEVINLTHPSHTSFHKTPLTSEELHNNKTRFYRWHIDSALYDLSPPLITTLLGIKVPPSSHIQTIDYDDGTKLDLTQGATCFISGEQAFQRLSAEDKEFALNSTVEYAPHPYIFIGPAKATSDGLTIVSEGKETPFDQLPDWEESKVKKLPMVWTNPVTGKHHLQVHSCCIYKIHTNGKVLELKEAREKAHQLMRPAIASENVLAHSWNQGDLVIFYNQGVLHSVTGEFKGAHEDGSDERRLMHQCNIASGKDPITVR